MKKIILIIVLVCSLSYTLAQTKNVQVFVRGKITEQFDHTPMGVEVRFEDPSGKFFKINSNSLTGKFEQVLSSDTKYKVRLFSQQIFPTEYELTTPSVTQYTEIEQNYTVIRLEPGKSVLAYDVYPRNQIELSNMTTFVDDINTKMRFNRNVKVKIEVLGLDSKNDFIKEYEKKEKKKIIKETKFDEKKYKDLINSRFNKIKEFINKFQYNQRISIDANYNLDIDDPLLRECSDCDIRIVITEYDPTIK